MRIPRVSSVGVTAHAALVRAGGLARVYAPLSSSIYMTADDAIIWLGADDIAHARAVLCDDIPHGLGATGATIMLDVGRLAPWRPPPGPRTPGQAAAMIAGARALGARVGSLGPTEGFAPLCAGGTPGFPLGRSSARALAAACAAGDAEAAAVAALALIGVGAGLTPSGDDFAGAAFFARALLARAGAVDAERWRAAADRVQSAAPSRTHPISAALLGDLLGGSAPAPLHDLAHALAAEASAAVADEAAQRLVRIGHTSGWDMLAGFVAGCAGLPG